LLVQPKSISVESRPNPAQEQNLALIRRIAWILDSSITIPFTKFRVGLDAVIGLIPWVGDMAGAIFSFGLLLLAARFGASRWTILRMSLNVLVEMLVGLIPFVGDVFDAVWKANERNVKLLERSQIQAQAGSRDFWFLLLLCLGFVSCLGLFVYGSFQTAVWLYHLALSAF